MMVWSTPAGYNLLVLGLERLEGGRLSVTVYEPARTDTEILKLRAGPDAPGLADNTVVLFGAGAIGSHIADLLTRSGVGTLHVHDTQRLRPGDVVRHAADRLYVGDFKTDAVRFKATLAAPWSEVRVHRTAPWKPSELAEAVAEADLVVDATGLKAFAAQLSLVCDEATKPMISAAAYRHGDLGRVRVQAGEPNDRIYDRADPTYPEIPRGADEAEVAWETGCAAPVAQAPPANVAAISATAARWAVDVLTGRADEDADVIEVYHPLADAPFNKAGTSIFRR
jgi:threonine dehydrogenase-like Zn-dependent dehydrogenase